MHYYLRHSPAESGAPRKLLGLLCLAVFLLLVAKIWLPYAAALFNATAITVLPPAWAEAYREATLPKTTLAATGNKITIKTDALNIEAPLVSGIKPDDLLQGVGWDPASAVPGSQGRVVVSGHRFWPDTSPWASVFFQLDRLKVGDKISIVYNNQTFVYRVTETWDVPKDKAYPQLAPTTQPILTVYTCGPTPYSARNRLGFNAVLDESHLRQSSPDVIRAIEDGVL